MELRSPINLCEEDKLEILQRLDQFRQWHSLDEKRYCLVCSKIITGWEIQVIGGTRGNEPLRIICPTENCKAIPIDWVMPTDEVIDKNCDAGGEGRDGAPPRVPAWSYRPREKRAKGCTDNLCRIIRHLGSGSFRLMF